MSRQAVDRHGDHLGQRRQAAVRQKPLLQFPGRPFAVMEVLPAKQVFPLRVPGAERTSLRQFDIAFQIEAVGQGKGRFSCVKAAVFISQHPIPLSSILCVHGGHIPLISRIITPILTLVNRGFRMIIFDKLWVLMKKKGVSTYQLRERCGIDSKTIRRLRANENMETKTLDKLCAALDCKLEDIAEYRKDGPVL